MLDYYAYSKVYVAIDRYPMPSPEDRKAERRVIRDLDAVEEIMADDGRFHTQAEAVVTRKFLDSRVELISVLVTFYFKTPIGKAESCSLEAEPPVIETVRNPPMEERLKSWLRTPTDFSKTRLVTIERGLIVPEILYNRVNYRRSEVPVKLDQLYEHAIGVNYSGVSKGGEDSLRTDPEAVGLIQMIVKHIS